MAKTKTELQRQWVEKNREYYNKYHREYRQRNLEKMRQYRKDYYRRRKDSHTESDVEATE